MGLARSVSLLMAVNLDNVGRTLIGLHHITGDWGKHSTPIQEAALVKRVSLSEPKVTSPECTKLLRSPQALLERARQGPISTVQGEQSVFGKRQPRR